MRKEGLNIVHGKQHTYAYLLYLSNSQRAMMMSKPYGLACTTELFPQYLYWHSYTRDVPLIETQKRLGEETLLTHRVTLPLQTLQSM